MARTQSPQAAKPLIGVMCCNEEAGRPVQTVATRFIEPLVELCGATVLLVPAVAEATDVAHVAALVDGLLLTGSRSNVSPARYGGRADPASADEARDAVALALAEQMIAAGKPVYGICRGFQEINVLFGGTLTSLDGCTRHHRGSWDGDYPGLFDHRHPIDLMPGGRLATLSGRDRLEVNSVHQQGIARLGAGLSVEAVASDDGLIEAVGATVGGADVLAVQWHPEWNAAACPGGRAFFGLFGDALRRSRERRGFAEAPRRHLRSA